MTATTVEIQARPHPGQREVHDHAARFKILACGRRWGKTRLGVNECLDAAAQGRRAWWVSPSYKMSEVGWRPLRQMAARVPGAEIRKVDRAIVLPGGGEVAVRSADNPDTLRGEGLDFVVIDECAFVAEEAWTEALRPALSDRRGRAMFISTPKGHNWFWRAFQAGQDPHNGEWAGWQFPTSSNPYIAESEIEAARLLLPERIYRQEYLAEFIDDAGGVIRNVTAVATASALQQGLPGRQYAMGIDWAYSQDFTVVTVMEMGSAEQVYLDRYNGTDYTLQRQRVMGLAARFKPAVILSEANAMGRPNNEELRRAGLPVQDWTTTNASKAQVIEQLAGAFERGALRILNDPVQIAELQAYEGERLKGGIVRYGAPDGLHDDTVIALALAYHAAQSGGVKVW